MRAILVTAVVALGIVLGSMTPALPAPTDVRVAVVPCGCFAPYFIAEAKGYFTADDVKIIPIQVTSGQDAISLLATGRIDVLFGAISAGFFNALAHDVEVKLVASMGGESLHSETAAVPLLVRSALVDGGQVSGIAGLKGRKVGLPGGIGSISSYDLAVYLRSGGLSVADVDVVNLPPTELIVALSSGAVDAGIVGSPFSTKIIEDGIGKPIVASVARILGRDVYKTAVLLSPAFLANNRGAAQRLMDALYRANEDLRGAGYASAGNLKIIAEATGLQGLALTRDRFYFSDDLDPQAVDLRSLQDVFVQMGVVRTPVKLGGVVDEGLVNNAKARFGN